MVTVPITTRRQLTLPKDVLVHLGVLPGGNIEVDLLPNSQVVLRAYQPSGTIDAFFGLLTNKTTKVATLEEIEEATAAAWAGER